MDNQKIKEKIFEINSMNIPQIEKSKLIFNLLNPNIYKKEENFDNSKKIIICKHSSLNLHCFYKCCNKFYGCRLCHDEEEDHEADRFNIDFVKCSFCNVIQKKSSSCQNPECFKYKKEHNYHCLKCNIWKNDQDSKLKIIDSYLIQNINTSSSFFHCEKCGICRIGMQKDYKHCDDCNMCLNKNTFDSHICKVNMKDKQCPICFENLWNSSKSCVVMKCGHGIHQACFLETLKNHNYYCSNCRKATIDLTDLWKNIDDYMDTQTMPDEYLEWKTKIQCRECNFVSTVQYHFEYHKCQSCNCYNTDIIEVIKDINSLNSSN